VKDPSAYISGGTQIEVVRRVSLARVVSQRMFGAACGVGAARSPADRPRRHRAVTPSRRDSPSGTYPRVKNVVATGCRRRSGAGKRHAARTAAPKPGRWAWLGGGAPIARPAATR
jgi:hypothetical protein